MKQILPIFLFSILIHIPLTGQELKLQKGVVIPSITVSKTSPVEDFALYLPKTYVNSGKWPLLMVFDTEGKGKEVLERFKNAADNQGYILAASNKIHDSISTSQNILTANRMLNEIFNYLPIHVNRVSAAGFSDGGRLATIMPSFLKGVTGVISVGAPISSVEILSSKKPFHFIGIVGDEDYAISGMDNTKSALDRLKFTNEIFFFDGGHEWPESKVLNKALKYLTLSAMAKGFAASDSVYIRQSLDQDLKEINTLLKANKLLRADSFLGEIIAAYRLHGDTDSLREKKRMLKKEKLFRSQKRNKINIGFKESLLRGDYVFYLEEDISTYNFNNLGWWNYQMEELQKFQKSANPEERRMGKRLNGFVNALIEDNIDLLEAEKVIDEEARSFLWMLKTIVSPKDPTYYLKMISFGAKYEDFGTALFYLEELLKQGYSNIQELYEVPDTSLLRITPEYNAIVAKYLKSARYDINEE